MKISIKILAIILISQVFLSCENYFSETFLEKQNQNELTDENYWKTYDDFVSGMGSVYSVMAISANFNGRGWELMNGRSDEYRSFVLNNENLHAYFLCTPSMQYVYMRYSFFYKGIFRANHVLDMIEKNEDNISEGEKNELIAEAKCLRAIYHFYLLQDYGYIAYCDKGYMTLTEMMENQYQVHQDVIFQKIIDDLLFSIEYLPESWDAKWTGRVTKGAAMAYAGTVYLNWMKFTEAAEMFGRITGPDPNSASVIGQYKLLANFSDLWEQDGENSQESVFEVQFGDGGGSNLWIWDTNSASLANFIGKNSTYQEEGWPAIIPYMCQDAEEPDSTWQYREFFRDRYKEYYKTSSNKVSDVYDPRLTGGLAFQWEAAGEKGKTYGGIDFISGGSSSTPGAVTWWGHGFALRKMMSFWEPHEPEKSVKNFPLIRYADVLLMKAEAENEIGNVKEAIKFIDVIRNRADLPMIQDQSDYAMWTQNDVRKEIEHQRYIEFFGEGKRWYDMLRWERNPNMQYNILDTLKAHDYPQGIFGNGLHPENYDVGKDEYLPIPAKALDANKNIKDNYDHTLFESINFKQ